MYDELKNLIQDSSNIVFFGGAGVSTESNIPDFRSESGLYHAQKSYGYSPETMLSHDFFYGNTEIFYRYYKENLIYRDAMPNSAHIGLAKLEETGKLKAVITQNIDGLHQKAGSKNVYELHGSVLRNTCTSCGAHFDLDYIMDIAHSGRRGNTVSDIPICDKCGAVVKPDVVLYGEALDDSVVVGAVNAIEKADLLIVGGTSLAVYPAAGLINYFHGKDIVLINKDATPFDNRASLVLHAPIGEVFRAILDL